MFVARPPSASLGWLPPPSTKIEESLSSAEYQVFALSSSGLPKHTIASALKIKPQTLDAYISHIKSKIRYNSFAAYCARRDQIAANDAGENAFPHLGEEPRKVLGLTITGHNAREIGESLAISRAAVQRHLDSIEENFRNDPAITGIFRENAIWRRLVKPDEIHIHNLDAIAFLGREAIKARRRQKKLSPTN